METTANVVETTLTVNHEHGLHARPADLFVRTANKFSCEISIYNQTKNPTKKANAKSILGLLSIGVRGGDRIRISADGIDNGQALEALTQLVENNFAE